MTEVLNGHSAASFLIFVVGANCAFRTFVLQAFVIVISGSAVLPALSYFYGVPCFAGFVVVIFIGNVAN